MFFLRGSKGIRWYDRGDANVQDYTMGGLTKDGEWHDLDLSAIVGTGQKLVFIGSYINETVGGKKIHFRTNGNYYEFNMSCSRTQVSNKTVNDLHLVYTDANGIIQYLIDAATWNAINLHIRGWFE